MHGCDISGRVEDITSQNRGMEYCCYGGEIKLTGRMHHLTDARWAVEKLYPETATQRRMGKGETYKLFVENYQF